MQQVALKKCLWADDYSIEGSGWICIRCLTIYDSRPIEREVWRPDWQNLYDLCGLPVFNSEIMGGLVSKVETSFNELIQPRFQSVFRFVPAGMYAPLWHELNESAPKWPKWEFKLPTYICFSILDSVWSISVIRLSGDCFMELWQVRLVFFAHQGCCISGGRWPGLSGPEVDWLSLRGKLGSKQEASRHQTYRRSEITCFFTSFVNICITWAYLYPTAVYLDISDAIESTTIHFLSQITCGRVVGVGLTDSWQRYQPRQDP